MITRRAPGKLLIVGEYAVVVPGAGAVVMAVDRYVTATGTPGRRGADVTVRSDLYPQRVLLRRHRTAPVSATDNMATGMAAVVCAIDITERWLLEHGHDLCGLDITITSALHEGGIKFGLGSSGAVTVATVDMVAACYGENLTPDQRFRLALLAAARLDPRASGADLAASTWGGWIRYCSPDRHALSELYRRCGPSEAVAAPWEGFCLEELPSASIDNLLVGWTGTPAQTSTSLSKLEIAASHPSSWFAAEMADCVSSVVEVLRRGDRGGLLAPIRRARSLLERWDDAAELGIFTDALRALCRAADEVDAAAKPSGAGGGDCGIAAVSDASAAEQLRNNWRHNGIRPLSLHTSPPGDRSPYAGARPSS